MQFKNPFDLIKNKETANVVGQSTDTLLDTSLCVVCKKHMQPILSNGVKSWVCFDHRVNLPMKDEN